MDRISHITWALRKPMQSGMDYVRNNNNRGFS